MDPWIHPSIHQSINPSIGSGNQQMTDQNIYCECVVRQCQILVMKPVTVGDWEVDGHKVIR